jgi:DnaJ-class molecular chaperone
VVKKHHPDVAHSEESKQRLLEIMEAYETRSDETKRRDYDEGLSRQRSELRIPNAPEIIQRDFEKAA